MEESRRLRGKVKVEIQTGRLQLAIDMPISRTLSESSGAETTKTDSKEGIEQGKEDNYNSYPRKWKHGGGGEEASTKVWGKRKIIGHSGNLTFNLGTVGALNRRYG